jgi:hypothetical protein
MSIICSRQNIRIAVPISIGSEGDVDAWLASMSDSAWRVLTDFRNWPDWAPELGSVKQTDSQPPARGTRLQVDRGYRSATGSIEVWDPPRCLQISINLAGGEMAYGFQVEASLRNAELQLSLELERSLIGVSRIAAFFFRWRLQKLGAQILNNLAARAQPAKND